MHFLIKKKLCVNVCLKSRANADSTAGLRMTSYTRRVLSDGETHSLTHSLVHLFSLSFTHLLIHSLTYPLTHPLTHSLIHSLLNSFQTSIGDLFYVSDSNQELSTARAMRDLGVAVPPLEKG